MQACAKGTDNQTVVAETGACSATVGTWQRRFLKRRLAGLADEPRPGAPRSMPDADVERAATRTLETKSDSATHWSTRGLARAEGPSHSSVGRIWRVFGLKPHRTKSFKLSTDPYFVEKVRDLVGLYMSPTERAIVLCVDEKSRVQALDRTQPLLPMTPGAGARPTHDCFRNVTTSLFAAPNVATGEVIGQCRRRHRHQEFLKFLNELDSKLAREIVQDGFCKFSAPGAGIGLERAGHRRFLGR